MFGIRVADVNGTPKILGRDSMQASCLEGDPRHGAAGQVRRADLVVEPPVPGFRRHGGRSTRTRSAWRMYAGALRLRKALADFRPRRRA